MNSRAFNDSGLERGERGYRAFEACCCGAHGESGADPVFFRPAKGGASIVLSRYPLLFAPPDRDEVLPYSVRSPAFYRQLLEIARYYGVMPSEPLPFVGEAKASCRTEDFSLTPRAYQIYQDLKVLLVARIKDNS